MSAPGGGAERLQRVKEVAAEEVRGYLTAFAYILVVLILFTVHEEMALRAHGGESQAIPFLPHGFALINALVLAKVALLVEDLGLARRIRAAPLIYPILLEAAILAGMFVAMHVLEGVLGGWIHGRPLALSVPVIAGGGPAGVIFALVSFFVAMLPYCAFRQVTRALGWPRMRALLFGPRPDAPAGRD